MRLISISLVALVLIGAIVVEGDDTEDAGQDGYGMGKLMSMARANPGMAKRMMGRGGGGSACKGSERLGRKGASYRGCQNRTRSGRRCQQWARQSPQRHGNKPHKKRGKGLEGRGNNYCRNPDGGKTIWCYTTDKRKRWEYCKPLTAAQARKARRKARKAAAGGGILSAFSVRPIVAREVRKKIPESLKSTSMLKPFYKRLAPEIGKPVENEIDGQLSDIHRGIKFVEDMKPRKWKADIAAWKKEGRNGKLASERRSKAEDCGSTYKCKKPRVRRNKVFGGGFGKAKAMSCVRRSTASSLGEALKQCDAASPRAIKELKQKVARDRAAALRASEALHASSERLSKAEGHPMVTKTRGRKGSCSRYGPGLQRSVCRCKYKSSSEERLKCKVTWWLLWTTRLKYVTDKYTFKWVTNQINTGRPTYSVDEVWSGTGYVISKDARYWNRYYREAGRYPQSKYYRRRRTSRRRRRRVVAERQVAMLQEGFFGGRFMKGAAKCSRSESLTGGKRCKRWEWSKRCRKHTHYRGCQNRTPSGRRCQQWARQSPHRHSRTPQKRPGRGLEGRGNNYCRNPDGSKTIWCYTTDKKKRWEYCKPLKKRARRKRRTRRKRTLRKRTLRKRARRKRTRRKRTRRKRTLRKRTRRKRTRKPRSRKGGFRDFVGHKKMLPRLKKFFKNPKSYCTTKYGWSQTQDETSGKQKGIIQVYVKIGCTRDGKAFTSAKQLVRCFVLDGNKPEAAKRLYNCGRTKSKDCGTKGSNDWRHCFISDRGSRKYPQAIHCMKITQLLKNEEQCTDEAKKSFNVS